MSEPHELLPANVNPYWSVWEAATGGGKPYEFMIWNQREWGLFDARHGYSRDHRSLHGDQFKRELSAKYAVQVEARFRSPTAIEQRRAGDE